MYYSNIETYLNEEVRKPIKHYLEDVPQSKQENIMRIVDYLCDRLRQSNGTCLFYEEKFLEGDNQIIFKEWQQYMEEKGYTKPIDYDQLTDIYTNEEIEDMLANE